MAFKYRAITANCGNDAIGERASAEIARHCLNDDLDFVVINCQEVDFEKTRQQLQAAVGTGYTVNCSAQMATHTKFKTQFHSGTGLATFVIHKADLDVRCTKSDPIRRSASRLSGGSGYNKGGLVSELTVRKKTDGGDEFIRVQSVSAHLESFNSPQKRTVDWFNINQGVARTRVMSWPQLVAASPHLRLSGHDANTRNKLDKSSVGINLWLTSPNDPEIQALSQVPLAGQQFSKDSTYKTNIDNVAHTADPKRPGYARGGMLDFVGIADGSDQTGQADRVMVRDVVEISSEEGSERDHNVIISPTQTYNVPPSEFEVVKGQIAGRLERVSPGLASQLRDLKVSDGSKDKLIRAYNLLLSKEGLLSSMINLHGEKLSCFDHLNHSWFLKNPTIIEMLQTTLFSDLPWLKSMSLDTMEEEAHKYSQKMQLMNLLLASLNDCQSEAGINGRLKLYHEFEMNINEGIDSPQSASEAFRQLSIIEYRSHLAAFTSNSALYDKASDPKLIAFKRCAQDILKQISDLVPTDHALNKLPPKSLAQISSVLEQCNNAVEAIKTKPDEIMPIVQNLAILSQEVSGKSSLRWKALGASLLTFAFVTLIVVGVLAAIPTGGASLLLTGLGAGGLALSGVGAGMIEYGEERGLAKSISTYKNAIQALNDDNDYYEDTGERDLPGL